jgi:F-type H+-transporting ATPase subunit gamma
MAEHMQIIRREIKSISSTERVTNAMKLVSASKLRRAKFVYEHSSELLKKISAAIGETFDNHDELPEELILGNREIKKTCYIVITASSGLCGSYNGNMIRRADEIFEEAESMPEIVTIGSKGKTHFERSGLDIIMSFDDSPDAFTYEDAQKMAQDLIEMYHEGEIDEIIILYTSFVNMLKQQIITERILPIDINEHIPESSSAVNVDYLPSPEEVFSYLTEKYLELRLYNAAIEAATCEHSARRTAMENANDNAREMLDSLQLRYNRARQAMITDKIIEIVAGSEAQQ